MGLGVVAVVLVALQLGATPLARLYVRWHLRHLDGYEGEVADVHARLVPPKLVLTNLRIVAVPGGDWRSPLLSCGRVAVTLAGAKLLRGAPVAHVVADRPVLRVVQRARSSKSPESAKEKAMRVPDLASELGRHAPLKVDALEIHDGELEAVDETRSPPPRLTVTGAEGRVDNLTTRAALADHRPTTVELTGRVQGSGLLRVSVRANPWAKKLDFDAKASLVHLRATDLGSLLVAKEKLEPVSGTVDLFVEVRARDGRLDGGVKPALHDVRMRPPEQSAMDRFKAWLANAALSIFSEHHHGEARLVTVVPIRGRITDPKAQLWPTVAGVIRNAFVEGIAEGFGHLPPPTAEKRESAGTQLEKALKGRTPRAQPRRRERIPESK